MQTPQRVVDPQGHSILSLSGTAEMNRFCEMILMKWVSSSTVLSIYSEATFRILNIHS